MMCSPCPARVSQGFALYPAAGELSAAITGEQNNEMPVGDSRDKRRHH